MTGGVPSRTYAIGLSLVGVRSLFYHAVVYYYSEDRLAMYRLYEYSGRLRWRS